MAKTSGSGNAPPITPQDFNERLKTLLAGKAEPQKAESRRVNTRRPKPLLRDAKSEPDTEA